MLLKKMYILYKVKNIDDKMSDITNLAINATLNSKINEVKRNISHY